MSSVSGPGWDLQLSSKFKGSTTEGPNMKKCQQTVVDFGAKTWWKNFSRWEYKRSKGLLGCCLRGGCGHLRTQEVLLLYPYGLGAVMGNWILLIGCLFSVGLLDCLFLPQIMVWIWHTQKHFFMLCPHFFILPGHLYFAPTVLLIGGSPAHIPLNISFFENL